MPSSAAGSSGWGRPSRSSERTAARLVVLEAEGKLAQHQTGHNSGVIHSGLYYKPGSLKARNCAEGRELMYRYCAENGIAHERCGKVVVATAERELPALAELERRGIANGLTGIRRLAPEEIREHEPHVAGIAGLFVAETGIVDYKQVAESYASKIRERGGDVRLDARLVGFRRSGPEFVLATTQGDVTCRSLVNCAGLAVGPRGAAVRGRSEAADRPVPRRVLRPGAGALGRWCKNLIYPVPDPRFPFLGVHFTRMIHGGVEAGPNAVLAFRREGYTRTSFRTRDVLQMLGYRGFWRMARKYYDMGIAEMYRSFSKRAFLKALAAADPGTAVGGHPPGRGGRAGPGGGPGRQDGGRLPDRRGGADGPRAQRPVARGDGVDQHRPDDRRHGGEEL